MPEDQTLLVIYKLWPIAEHPTNRVLDAESMVDARDIEERQRTAGAWANGGRRYQAVQYN
jgi:hypothetical protein